MRLHDEIDATIAILVAQAEDIESAPTLELANIEAALEHLRLGRERYLEPVLALAMGDTRRARLTAAFDRIERALEGHRAS